MRTSDVLSEMCNKDAVFEELLRNPPALHEYSRNKVIPTKAGLVDGTYTNSWKLSNEDLRFIRKHVGPNSYTIETGAGCSTIVFALMGCHHTVIAPDNALFNRIVDYCAGHGIGRDQVNFECKCSEDVLPGCWTDLYDLALIDGRHGFPQPFFDWYYLSQMLKIGGYLILDDLHLYGSEILFNFMLNHPSWVLDHECLGSATFKKIGDVNPYEEICNQPFMKFNSRQEVMVAKLRYLKGLIARHNWSLLMHVMKLGFQSVLCGRFGERPNIRR